MEHGIEFEVKDMYLESREDAKLWILENQLGRRNLTDVARIELALKKEKLLKELAKEKLKRAGGDKYGNETPLTKSSTASEKPAHVRKNLAKKAQVSETMLFRYKQIMEQGSPKLIEAVQSGKLKIGAAQRMLPRQIEKQLEQVDKLYEHIKMHLPTITDEEEKEEIRGRLLGLREQLEGLIERKRAIKAESKH